MSSTRPYLLRAMYEWIRDNGFTPYILVDATVTGTRVPPQYIEDGRIVLNIAERAVNALEISNEQIHFRARFSGITMEVFAPISAVLAIYARENGRGMAFDQDSGDDLPPPPAISSTSSSIEGTAGSSSSGGKGKPPHLRIVK